jgi:lipoprotein-releasing system permease protein
LSFPLYIAKRYLFTKTSNNAINIITIIASFGVIIGSLALFIILSGFSGLRTFSYSLLEVSDPDLKITAVKGKSFLYTNDVQQNLKNDRSIKVISKVIEERVFLKYKDKNEIAFIKGVEENYNLITQIDSTLHVGNWLDADYTNTAVIGYGISRKLSLGILSFGEPLQIMVPKKRKRIYKSAKTILYYKRTSSRYILRNTRI